MGVPTDIPQGITTQTSILDLESLNNKGKSINQFSQTNMWIQLKRKKAENSWHKNRRHYIEFQHTKLRRDMKAVDKD